MFDSFSTAKTRVLGLGLFMITLVQAQTPRGVPSLPHSTPAAPANIVITVIDENGVVVSSARVFLFSSPSSASFRCETDFTGHCNFRSLVPGRYLMRVEKQGFYALANYPVQVGSIPGMEVRLSHLQEVREVVNVVESPPGIDPQQTVASEQLTGMDVLNIPYPATHDYRNVLKYIPGVVQDVSGQPHIVGAETYQTLTLLDGFNLTQPANGLLLLRVSPDAIRSINADSSRISAEYGKGSGGVLSINTGIGDDHYRLSATNFIPSAQVKKGLAFNNILPRVTFSGPLKKEKVWFFEGLDAEYDNNITSELPSGSDTDKFWRVGNLAKLQVNLAPGNILTAAYLINRQRDQYYGLSIFSPQSATPSDREAGDFAMVRNQIYFPGGELLDYGFNFDQYVSDLTPRGAHAYAVTPASSEGSYYLTLHTVARRWQGLANVSFAPQDWHGRHEFKLGFDLDRLAYNPILQRTPISYLRAVQSPPVLPQTCLTSIPSPCSRYSVFALGPQAETHNAEISGYVQDRWTPAERLLMEAGLRFDWDEIVRDGLVSPRLAGTYVLDREGNTKLSAGIGVFFDQTNMVLVSRPFAGQRTDYFFDANVQATAAPVPVPVPNCPSPGVAVCSLSMMFSVDQRLLHAPRFLNWSLALERKLPAAVYLKVEFIRRHGKQGLVYNLSPGSPALSGHYFLANTRQDHYDGLQISLRKAFRKTYLVTGAYTRSHARSNQVLDFNVDNPIYSPQMPGPYLWDAPNRFLTTGIVPISIPILRKLDLEYSAEARTGFPFYAINNQQQLVPTQFGKHRFPPHFSLNVFLEKRFTFRRRHWAIRGGFDNITGHRNPAYVNNNVDSSSFGTFGGLSRRTFTTRIRFLGKK